MTVLGGRVGAWFVVVFFFCVFDKVRRLPSMRWQAALSDTSITIFPPRPLPLGLMPLSFEVQFLSYKCQQSPHTVFDIPFVLHHPLLFATVSSALPTLLPCPASPHLCAEGVVSPFPDGSWRPRTLSSRFRGLSLSTTPSVDGN